MKWSMKEDIIVCNFYLRHRRDYHNYIRILQQELLRSGYLRDYNSIGMRLANFQYIDTGRGLSHPAKQSITVYNMLTKGED